MRLPNFYEQNLIPNWGNYNFIGGIIPPLGLKDVEFEKFDIDDMPGASSITIA